MFASLTIYAHLRTNLRLFAIAGIAAALTHCFGAIVVGILIIHGLLRGRHRGARRRQWFAAIAFVLAICALWGAYAIGLIRTNPSIATFDPQAAFLMMAGAFSVNSSTRQGVYNPHLALVAAIFFLGLFFSWRDSPAPLSSSCSAASCRLRQLLCWVSHLSRSKSTPCKHDVSTCSHHLYSPGLAWDWLQCHERDGCFCLAQSLALDF